MTPAESTPAVIYTRVSTKQQGASGLGLESQEARCRAECERRGWVVAEVITEVVSGDKAKRPLFAQACQHAKDLHGVLVSASLDRISRGGVMTVLPLYERAGKEGWHIFAMDMPEVDTTSPMGEMVLTIFAAVGRMERRLTGQRTSHSLREKFKRGEPVGRPRTIPECVIARLRSMRSDGLSLQQMADALNEERIATHMGPMTAEEWQSPARWHKQSVHQAVKRYGVAP